MGKDYCVYVHTNKTNGKRYVGITSMNPQRRWSNGNGYRSNVLFYRAIQKYGWDGFKHEVLASGLSKHTACETEIELIRSQQLTNPKYGYNLDNGGNGSNRLTEKTRKKLSDKIKRYYAEHPEFKQKNAERLRMLALKNNNYERLAAYYAAHPEAVEEHSKRMKAYYREHPERGVEHSQKLKKHYTNHPELRELKSKQTKEYFREHPEAKEHLAQKTREYYQNPDVKKWKSEERKKYFAEHPEKKTAKPIEQYTTNGILIKRWDSGVVAEREGGYNRKLISACVTGKQNTACGFVWRYANDLQDQAI